MKKAETRETSEYQKDGNIVHQVFKNDVRTEKILTNQDNQLLKRWVFETEMEKIVRLEDYAYKDGKLEKYRIAEWSYKQDGFVKINSIYNHEKKLLATFEEQVNKKGIKFKERWKDAKGRLTSQKVWDKENGNFKDHFLIQYYPNGWSLRIHYNEGGQRLGKILLTPEGKEWKRGNILNMEGIPKPQGI